MMRQELCKTIYWTQDNGTPKPLASNCVEATKSVVMLDLALKAEIETGIYKTPIDVLAKEIHYEPLPPEIRTVIIAAWQRVAVAEGRG